MASHFKWYPSSEETIVPWNARYQFPSQANKAIKMTPRIPPKNGATFTPGQVIRLEFPAQGYVNPLNTTLEFDVTLQSYGTPGSNMVRFQNNIQSIFNRVRLLYGATPLEDIINYNVVVRALTEWTGTTQTGTMDQTSISEGIGGVVIGASSDGFYGPLNVRQAYIQGIDFTSATSSTGNAAFGVAKGSGSVPQGGSSLFATGGTYSVPGYTVQAGTAYVTRRYQVNFALGMFTQDKLIPTKFMASQLAIELTLEQPASCIFSVPGYSSGTTANTTSAPTYTVGNVNLIPEILEFDASYDSMFLQGLRDGGVPIKFSSWHTFIFSSNSSANINLLVQERSRSVKALFAVQRKSPAVISLDSHAFLFDSSNYDSSKGNSLQNYQFRIGGRYLF